MTLALYRAYRPGTLADVVGQDHVTAPLRRALITGRVHHAYLFSGPRGCGKTSTARILARSLNCVRGPTPDPCGVCDSCVALAPNGPGSQDVIELDAASHGGVDDTRDLRERVIYSPASSRYRIYIIDEAHMVTTQGFNALLKVIEEPPDYVRFIFATTEPEKVLGTIRSRTFNYAFRLVSAGVLSAHLATVCRAEGVPYDEAALPLIAKAAGGSVRDALSVLGQLIAGSADDGLTADYVASGLGLTDAVLLDRVVAAIASRDGAGAFAAVDAVVESGHDGRRFLTDLLERLRDLILLHYVPPEQHGGLLQLPPDQIEAMRAQGALFGSAELSRAADLVSVGLSELKGATAPRLQLELLLARLLLPGADDAAEGHGARLDRLEREVGAAAVHGPSAPAAAPAPPAPTHAAPTGPDAGRGAPDGQRTGGQPAGSQSTAAPAPASGGSAAARSAGQRRQQPGSRAAASATPPPRLSDLAPATGPSSGPQAAPDQQAPQDQPPAPAPDPQAARASAADAAQRPAGQAGGTAAGGPAPSASAGGTAGAGGQAPSPRAAGPELSLIRDNWPAVMTELGRRSRVAWTLWDSSQPVAADDRELTVAVADQGRLTSIRSSNRSELLRQVIIDVLRLDLKVNPVLVPAGPAADADAGSASPDDPDLGDADVSGVDLVIRELGAVPIGEIGEQ